MFFFSELAVANDDKIELLMSNGSLVGSIVQQFNKLKGLTFDNVRHQFVTSDMDHQNDTIYTVQLSKQTESAPIIEDLPDDVQVSLPRWKSVRYVLIIFNFRD